MKAPGRVCAIQIRLPTRGTVMVYPGEMSILDMMDWASIREADNGEPAVGVAEGYPGDGNFPFVQIVPAVTERHDMPKMYTRWVGYLMNTC